MALRDKMNEHPGIATGISVGAIVLVIGYIVYGTMGRGVGGGPPPVGNRVFYTDDDGAHWFADDATKIPPFDHDGKQAVRAKVYRCDGKAFVGHMERYTPEAQKRLQEVYARAANGAAALPAESTGLEVKAPGGDRWVSVIDPAAASIMSPKCPSGNLEIVTP